MAKVFKTFRKSLNENIGLMALIFLFSATCIFKALIKYYHWENTDIETIGMVIFYYAICSFSLTAVAEAIFRKRF
jgi:hypothetical protein